MDGHICIEPKPEFKSGLKARALGLFNEEKMGVIDLLLFWYDIPWHLCSLLDKDSVSSQILGVKIQTPCIFFTHNSGSLWFGSFTLVWSKGSPLDFGADSINLPFAAPDPLELTTFRTVSGQFRCTNLKKGQEVGAESNAHWDLSSMEIWIGCVGDALWNVLL